MDQLLPRPVTPGDTLFTQQNNMIFQDNCARSQNEQALYAAWKHAVEKNNTLNTHLNTLQAQMQELRNEIKNLKGSRNRNPSNIPPMRKNSLKRQSGSYTARETPKGGKWKHPHLLNSATPRSAHAAAQ